MLGSILKQLLERQNPGARPADPPQVEKGNRPTSRTTLRLGKILRMTTALLPEVFIYIDGLDECPPKNRQELLESHQKIVRALLTMRVFLSRTPHICNEVKRSLTEAIMIPVIPTIGDIERYLKVKLEKDPTPGAMDDSLRAEIVRVILGKFLKCA